MSIVLPSSRKLNSEPTWILQVLAIPFNFPLSERTALFMLRYGLVYVEERDEHDQIQLQNTPCAILNILRPRQLSEDWKKG